MPPAVMSPQCQIVYDYLKQGRTLTNLVALTALGVGSLSSRIAELRGHGVEIDDKWATDRFGRQFKKYRLHVEEKGEYLSNDATATEQ